MSTEPEVLHPYDGRVRRRLLLTAACFGMSVFAMSCVILASALVPIAAEFKRTNAQCGVLLAYAPAGFMLVTLLGGYLSDRWGQRVFVLTGFGVLVAGLALASCAERFSVLGGGIFLMGMSGGFIESPLSAVTVNAFPDKRAQALTLTQIFFNVGAVLGPAIVGLVLWWGWGWRAGFRVFILLALGAFVLAFIGLPTMKQHRAAREVEPREGPIRWGIVCVMALTIFLYVGSEMTMAQWSAKYLHDTFKVPEARATLVVSGFWLGMMFGRALYIKLVGRLGYLVPLMMSAVLACAAAVGASMARSATTAAIACCLAAFFYGGSWPTILGYTAHKTPGRTGTVFGILVAAGSAGCLTFQPLAGWLSYLQRLAYGLRAVMMLSAAAIFLEGLVILGVWLWDRNNRSVTPRIHNPGRKVDSR